MRSQPRQRASRAASLPRPRRWGAGTRRVARVGRKQPSQEGTGPHAPPEAATPRGARDALPERAVRVAGVSARRAQPAPLAEKLLEQGGGHAGRRRTGVAQLGARRRPPAPTAAPPPPWAPQSYDRN